MAMDLYENKIPVIRKIIGVYRFVSYADYYPVHNLSRRAHGLLWAVEGQETYKSEDSKLVTNPDDVFYLPKSAEYHLTMKGEKCTVICIDFEMAEESSGKWFGVHPKNKNLANLFLQAEHIWKMRKIGYELECMSVLYKILSEIQTQMSSKYYQSKKRTQIQTVVDYFHSNFDNPDLRVETLAEQSGFSPRYFYKLFHEVYGVSPKQYITTIRMEKAKELLLSSGYSVNQISLMTGYSDIYHFSKLFKQVYGLSPTEYRTIGKVR